MEIAPSEEKPMLYINVIEGPLIDKIGISGHQNEKVMLMENWKPVTYHICILSDAVKYGSQKLSDVN